MKSFAIWMRWNDHLTIIDTSSLFPKKLLSHLIHHPPKVDGDTHLAQFFRAINKRKKSGRLTNTMPGSTFTHYCFQKLRANACEPKITLVVAWYWTQ